MNDLPRQKLAEIVKRYGPSVCEDPRRCRALLMDLCGEYRREIFCLVSAVEEEVAAELREVQSGVPVELLLERLTNRLVDNCALDEEAACWTVESWALALGIKPPPRPARRPRPRRPAPRSDRIDDRRLAALVQQVAGLSHVELTLAHGDVTDAGLAHLAALPNLTALDLFECTRITNRGLTYLRGLTRLTSLDLTGTQITDVGLARLTTLSNLSRLDLSRCAGITDNGLAYLRAFTRLTHLDLSGTGITDVGLSHLRGLHRLVGLNLQGCERVTSRGVQALRRPGRDIQWP